MLPLPCQAEVHENVSQVGLGFRAQGQCQDLATSIVGYRRTAVSVSALAMWK